MTKGAITDDGRRLLEKCALFRALDEPARRELAALAHRRSILSLKEGWTIILKPDALKALAEPE